MDSLPPFRLSLLAAPSLTTRDGIALTGRAIQRHRLALLALLSRAPDAGVTRDVLLAQLWPERGAERARNLLNVSVYVLRQVLGEQAIASSGQTLRLSGEVVATDVHAFESDLRGGALERAVTWYRGPFLDGFFLPDAPDFMHWVDRERARLADGYAHALESLAEAAERSGDGARALGWWRQRADHDPYDSRVALRLMTALAANGSSAGALRHAEHHERLLREELDLELPPRVAEMVVRLRQEHGEGWTRPDPRWDLPVPSDIEPLSTSVAHATSAHEPGASARAGVRARTRGWLLLSLVPLMTAVLLVGRELMGGRSAPEQVAAVARAPSTSSPAAWDLYRRATDPAFLRSDDGAREALSMLRRAVELDGRFAEGHAALARMYLRVAPAEDAHMSRRERLEQAHDHALRATGLDGSLSDAYAVLGLTEMLRYRFHDAERYLARARELDPGDPRILEWLVTLLVREGRAVEALAVADQALRSDPLSPTARAEHARALVANGRCAEAVPELAELADLTPPLLRVGPMVAHCRAERDDWAGAVSAVNAQPEVAGAHAAAIRAYYLARSGRTAEAEAVLAGFVATAERNGEEAFDAATVLVGLRRTEEAFVWLDRSVEDYSFSSDVIEPVVAELRGDPRFARILEKAGVNSRPGNRSPAG